VATLYFWLSGAAIAIQLDAGRQRDLLILGFLVLLLDILFIAYLLVSIWEGAHYFLTKYL